MPLTGSRKSKRLIRAVNDSLPPTPGWHRWKMKQVKAAEQHSVGNLCIMSQSKMILFVVMSSLARWSSFTYLASGSKLFMTPRTTQLSGGICDLSAIHHDAVNSRTIELSAVSHHAQKR